MWKIGGTYMKRYLSTKISYTGAVGKGGAGVQAEERTGGSGQGHSPGCGAHQVPRDELRLKRVLWHSPK